jgi:hypothetical protein
MTEAHAPCRVVALRGALLSVAEVQRVATELAGGRAFAIDCATLRAVTAEGLAALLALGERGEPLALTGLSRELMKVAVEARLARTFTIYVDRQAFEHAQRSRDDTDAHARKAESA